MTVTVSDWTTGFNKVRFNDLLRQATQVSA